MVYCAGGGLNLVELWGNMGPVAKGVAGSWVSCRLWSFGVAIRALLHLHAGAQAVEAVRTAGGQAPEGRTPEGRAVRSPQAKTYQYSHWPKWCSPVFRNISSSTTAVEP
jgi:hypothetical protein